MTQEIATARRRRPQPRTVLTLGLTVCALLAGLATPAYALAASTASPQITITSPAAGVNYQGVDLQVDASASEPGSTITSLSASLDGTAIPLPDSFPSDNLPPGSHTLVVTAVDTAGNFTTVTRVFSTSVGDIPASRYDRGQVGTPPRSGPDGPNLVVAGDIACSPGSAPTPSTCQQAGTARVVQSLHPSLVATIGDEQYQVGTLSNFDSSYNLSWGKFKKITYPVIGNHEYAQANYPGAQATGYFDYFDGPGSATGRAGNRNRGYYAYDLGSWHIVVLNAECGAVSCAAGSGQQVWLAHDLAANRNRCVLAMWHQPLFTAGITYGDPNGLATRPLWDTLYAYGADVIINGHDHNYQRFAPQTPSGHADPAYGIREFVVGTGGESQFPLANKDKVANLQASETGTFGVLQLRLRPDSYTWHFIPEPGQGRYTDSGSARCHGASPTPTR